MLAKAKKAEVTGSGSSAKHTSSISFSTSTKSTSSTVTRGHVTGHARLDVEVDVTTAGDGAITIKKTSSLPSFKPPKVASANCNASKKRTTRGV